MAVNAKSFSAAAEILGVSQPSVSEQMRALERKVGVALFDRVNGSAPHLTEGGKRFLVYANEAIALTRTLEFELRQNKPCLRCATHRSVAYALLPRPLAMFSEVYPDFELIMDTGEYQQILGMFHSRQVDMLFLLTAGEIPEERTELIGRCPLVFFASPKHQLSALKRIDPSRLSLHPFVFPQRESYFARIVQDLMKKVGVDDLKFAARMHEAGLVRELVVAGVGISCSLRENIAKDIAEGSLVELDVDVPPLYLELRVARHYLHTDEAVLNKGDKLIELVKRATLGH